MCNVKNKYIPLKENQDVLKKWLSLVVGLEIHKMSLDGMCLVLSESKEAIENTDIYHKNPGVNN